MTVLISFFFLFSFLLWPWRPLHMTLSKSAESFPKGIMPSWLSRHISRDLDFLKCGCQHGNPDLPSGGQGHDKKSITVYRKISNYFSSQMFSLKSALLEGWEGEGLLYNMDLIGFAHWVFITRPHKKQKRSVKRLKKIFFLTKIDKSGGLTHSPLCGS